MSFPFCADVLFVLVLYCDSADWTSVTPSITSGTGNFSLHPALAIKCKSSVSLLGHDTVPGHKSALAFGFLSGGEGKKDVPVVAMLGRVSCFFSAVLG